MICTIMAKHITFLVPASLHIGRSFSSTATIIENQNQKVPNIEIRKCCTHEELDECVRLQQYVWRFSDLDAVPRRALLVTNNIGGVVLGAFASNGSKSSLLGFLWNLPGICPKTKPNNFILTEMIAVHPDARNYRIAQRLLWSLRDYALSQNIKLVKGNFDPTEAKLAHLYISRLGSIGRRYTPAYYGSSSSSLHQKLPTDRMHVECWLDPVDKANQMKLYSDNELFSTESNSSMKVYIPADMAEWKRTGDPRAVKAQTDIREKLMAAFERGFVVWGFQLEKDGTGVYQLELGYCKRNE